MPSQYTHQLIAEAVLDRLPEHIRAAISSPAAFALGAQGGDAFFFCWLGSPRRNLGRRMHCGEIYRDFCMLAGAQGAQQRSYAAGYVCHYAADTVFHPFVYALCEQFGREESARAKWHAYIESDLDAYFIASRLGIPVAAYRMPVRYADVDVSALAPLFRAVAGVRLSEHTVRAALRRFFAYVGIFRDEFGRRRRFFAGAERFLHAPRLLSCLYRRVDYDARVLNAAGERWCNPSDPRQSSCEGADALFERAVSTGVRLVTELYLAQRGAALPKPDFSLHFLKGTPVRDRAACMLASDDLPVYTESGGDDMQKFYDSNRCLVGYLRESETGKIFAYDICYRLKGYYNPTSDKTYDSNCTLLGRGNLLATFFKDAVGG